jgi:hypothetical protein
VVAVVATAASVKCMIPRVAELEKTFREHQKNGMMRSVNVRRSRDDSRSV